MEKDKNDLLWFVYEDIRDEVHRALVVLPRENKPSEMWSNPPENTMWPDFPQRAEMLNTNPIQTAPILSPIQTLTQTASILSPVLTASIQTPVKTAPLQTPVRTAPIQTLVKTASIQTPVQTAPNAQVPSQKLEASASTSSQPWIEQRKRVLICYFCKKNNESVLNYTGHRVKDAEGNVTCPVLFAYKCKHCGATGPNGHTETYCPKFRQENLIKHRDRPPSYGTALQDTKRNSTGIRPNNRN